MLAGTELAGSTLAGVAAAILFGGSYTFWSQSIIAEVYALHIAFVALTLLCALRWAERPTRSRLAWFFATYALGFGNHLSMILLAPGFAVFLLLSAPGGWRALLGPRVVALAATIAMAGALQYTWNLKGLWMADHPPSGLVDAVQTFWFDVTKSDWRETMVLDVPGSLVRERVAMYGFDVLQQFGWAVLLAPIGLIHLLRVNPRAAALMFGLYAVCVLFAFGYNVGDAHVFYLPSHAIVALLAAPGLVAIARARPRAVAAVCALGVLYGAVRIYRDYPALDRSADRRPAEVMTRLTGGVDEEHAVLIADLNWQLVNGLAYFTKVVRPDVPFAWLREVLLYLPALTRDNVAAGRELVLTPRARELVAQAYGPLLPIDNEPAASPSLAAAVANLPPGTRYVLCVLRPTPDFVLDREDLAKAVDLLTGRSTPIPDGDYVAIAGVVSAPPTVAQASARPFRESVQIEGIDVQVRMESWLTFDTIRRMGFGQVIAARRHTLIVERGVSFVAFDGHGVPIRTGYSANIFAPQPRYRIRRLNLE